MSPNGVGAPQLSPVGGNQLAMITRTVPGVVWDRRHGALRQQPQFIGSLRLIVAPRS